MNTLYLYRQFIFCLLIITIPLQASDLNGFHVIRSGYYTDALNIFSLKNDSISKLGTQYCYLRMNNIKFDLEKTSEYLFSENLPDSIFEKSSIPLIIESKLLPELCMFRQFSLTFSLIVPSRSTISHIPIIAFIGVLISCDTSARKSLFARFAFSA